MSDAVQDWLRADSNAAKMQAGNRLVDEIARLRALLAEASANGLIYWEPQTARGYAAKASLVSRIEDAIRSEQRP
jgi:hypothetical protein